MRMEIKTKGIPEVVQQIQQTIRSVQDRAKLHDHIGVKISQWIDQNFKAEGLEKKWAPLAASTLFGRRMGGRDAKILQNNGRLRASHTYRATADRVVVGFPERSTAEFHHFGTDPYTIRPKKSGGFLMFFMPPGGIGKGNNTTLIRRKSGTPKVGMVSASEAKQRGLKVPVGKGGMQSVAFRREVHHPGLKARPLLPTQPLAESLVQKVVQEYLKNALNGKEGI